MSAERPAVLAVGAHPDDVEFHSAGTLSLLIKAGLEPHIFTVANGSGGSVEFGAEELVRIRRDESHQAAALLGATYHQGLVDDLMIYYEDSLLRRVAAVVREVKPTIVLLPSPNDYMEDHMNTSRLLATACFSRCVPNYITNPPRQATFQDVYLYHSQPVGNRDGVRNLVVPEIVVDIGAEIDLKEEMLRCHASQKEWLDKSMGLDNYLQGMRELCSETAAICGVAGITYAEGWRRHSHIGYSAQDKDLLSEVLKERATTI